jgi:hypothetical protein
MRTAALCVLAVALVAACATPARPVWVKTGASEAERKKDHTDCLKAAATSSRETASFGAFSFDRDAYDRCMRARGYTAQAQR